MYGWFVIKWKGARMEGDCDEAIVVASGNCAVPVVGIELGGVDMRGEDVEMIGVEDVGGLELILGFDDVGLIVPVTMKDAVPV